MKLKRRYLLSFVGASLLGAVLYATRAVAVVWAMSRSTDRFVAWADEPRVLYEPGAERLAQVVAAALPEAVRMVEERQYRPFAEPVRVYVCASMESFNSYSPTTGYAGGFVLNKRLFISPKPENTAERMPRLLTHELSHLHLEQRLGWLHWHSTAPPWFQEGLAVYVSGGGGAENVSEEEARAAIAQGRCLTPDVAGSLLFRRDANAFGLPQHMFYRQSALFIGYLHRDEAKFRSFLLAVEDGMGLEPAFEGAFEETIDAAWGRFVAEVAGLPQ